MFWTIILALFCYEVTKDILYATIKVLSQHLKWVNDKHDPDAVFDEELGMWVEQEKHIPLYTGNKRRIKVEEEKKPRKSMIGFGED